MFHDYPLRPIAEPQHTSYSSRLEAGKDDIVSTTISRASGCQLPEAKAAKQPPTT